MPTLISIRPKACLVYVRNRKSTPFRSAIPATVRLAEAPISVPLPPRQAPNDRAHHSGANCSGPPRCGANSRISGIIAATNGMLSTMAERTADPQRIAMAVAVGSCPVAAISCCAAMLSSPAASMPCTMTNSPRKKKIVIQSTSAKVSVTRKVCFSFSRWCSKLWNSIRIAAPNSAIVPGCNLSGPANTKAAITPKITISEARISGMSVIMPRSSSDMTRARASGHDRRHQRQHRQHRPGLGAPLFGGPHSQVLEHAAAPRDRHQHHHPGQQRDRVEINAADRLVLAQHAGDDHRAGAEHRDDRAVDPVGDDEDVAQDKQDRRRPDRINSEKPRPGGDLMHARSFLLPIVPPGRSSESIAAKGRGGGAAQSGTFRAYRFGGWARLQQF